MVVDDADLRWIDVLQEVVDRAWLVVVIRLPARVFADVVHDDEIELTHVVDFALFHESSS